MLQGLQGYTAWRAGDHNALNDTVIAYNKRLVYYIFSLTGQTDLAEDVAADVFVKLMLKKPSFQSEEQLSSWLFKAARNGAVDALRRHSRNDRSLDEAETLRSEGEDLLDDLLFDERKKQLHAALNTLPEDSRSVLTLLYFENFSYKDISEILKKSEKQVKNTAYRARIKLKEELERMGFIYEN